MVLCSLSIVSKPRMSFSKTEIIDVLWQSGNKEATDNQKFLSIPQALDVIRALRSLLCKGSGFYLSTSAVELS